MAKDFFAENYVVDDYFSDTFVWLYHHQDCFESFEFDVFKQELKVYHVNGIDVIRCGMFLTAKYGILVTSL